MKTRAIGVASAFLLAGLSLFLVATSAASELRPINPFAATEIAPAPPSAFAPPVAAPFQAPGPLGRLFAWAFDKQQSLQRSLATSVKDLKADNPLGGAITLAALSFVYGVLHAVGPGHGKTIISSYVVANEETVRRGVIISFIAAGLQALTAVVLVGMLLIALGATGLQVNAWSNQLETISYAMIALVGLYPCRASSGACGAAGREMPQPSLPRTVRRTATAIITTITTTTTIITAMTIMDTITRPERRATIWSTRGSLPARSPGARLRRWCSRSASDRALARSSFSSLR